MALLRRPLSSPAQNMKTFGPDTTATIIAHTLELDAAYLDNRLLVLRSDKRAIFKHTADAQRACDYLVAALEAGQCEQAA